MTKKVAITVRRTATYHFYLEVGENGLSEEQLKRLEAYDDLDPHSVQEENALEPLSEFCIPDNEIRCCDIVLVDLNHFNS